MKFLIVPIVMLAAICLGRADFTPQQKAIISALAEYQEDAAAFEEITQRATAAEIPASLINMMRLGFLLHQAEFEKVKALLPAVEASRPELHIHAFAPTNPEVFDDLITLARSMVSAWQKDPEGARKKAATARKQAQAKSIMEDLRRIDAASDMASIERNKRSGEMITPEVWRTYLDAECRLHRTGADCFGNPYGAVLANKLPMVNRISFERIKDAVPPDFFKPYFIGP